MSVFLNLLLTYLWMKKTGEGFWQGLQSIVSSSWQEVGGADLTTELFQFPRRATRPKVKLQLVYGNSGLSTLEYDVSFKYMT